MTEEEKKTLSDLFEAMGKTGAQFQIGQVIGSQTNTYNYYGGKQKEAMNAEGAKPLEQVCAKDDILGSDKAMKYWKRLQTVGFVDEQCQLSPNTTRKQAMYIADMFSERLQMRAKWKVFQDLWHINNLAQEKWEMQETGKAPVRSREIEDIFRQ